LCDEILKKFHSNCHVQQQFLDHGYEGNN
jgi:hypothetical protein